MNDGPFFDTEGLVPLIMKQLNWWQGFWRVWVIGTVAWASVTFWQSNPRCLIIDGDRWCYYRSDFEYYAWLLVQMFGWPVLIAILLLALALGYRRVFGAE